MYNFEVQNKSIEELYSLKGKTAVVTGSAQGIGLYTTYRLAEAGANIVIGDLQHELAAKHAKDIANKFGVKTYGGFLDISKTETILSFIDTVTNQFKTIDIWVNNAGVFPIINSLDITDTDYDKLMNTNMKGSFAASREAAKVMQHNPTGGVILNISSISGLKAATNSAHYVASKHAIYGMTKAFARDFAPLGIRVLAIAPTLVETPTVLELEKDSPEAHKALDSIRQGIPLGRAAKPDDIARIILFAVSDMASFMTGSILVADGGDMVM